MPSVKAAFHEPPYHFHETALADSMSPMLAWVCGGSVVALDVVAYSASEPETSAGALPLGW